MLDKKFRECTESRPVLFSPLKQPSPVKSKKPNAETLPPNEVILGGQYG